MSDEMKLLMALCDALGFDVKTELDYAERKEHIQPGSLLVEAWPGNPRRCETDNNGGYIIDSNGNYTTLLKTPITSYVVSKKGGMVDVMA